MLLSFVILDFRCAQQVPVLVHDDHDVPFW
jgi:hypothetical protein